MRYLRAHARTGTDIQDVHLDAIRAVVPDANLEYKNVTVRGQVEKVISPSAFALSDPDDSAVKELLIGNQSGAGAIKPESKIRVTGIEYRGVNDTDVKQETGIDLDEAVHKRLGEGLLHRGLPSRGPKVIHV